MPAQTAFGRSIAAVVERVFATSEGVRLIDIEEPGAASYIKVIFETDDRRVQVQNCPGATDAESVIRDTVQRHIAFARRKRKNRL